MAIDIDSEINSIVDDYAKDTVNLLKIRIREDDTIASGQTIASIKYRIVNNDVFIDYNDSLDIVSKGIPIGKRVRVANILSWMNQKGIVPRNKPNTLAGRRSTAFIIARSMEKNGTVKRFANKGTNVLNSIGEGTALFDNMQNSIALASQRYIDELISNI